MAWNWKASCLCAWLFGLSEQEQNSLDEKLQRQQHPITQTDVGGRGSLVMKSMSDFGSDDEENQGPRKNFSASLGKRVSLSRAEAQCLHKDLRTMLGSRPQESGFNAHSVANYLLKHHTPDQAYATFINDAKHLGLTSDFVKQVGAAYRKGPLEL